MNFPRAKLRWMLLGVGLLVAVCAPAGAASDAVVARLVAHARAHSDGKAPVSFDAAAWSGDQRALPIGVFDSGIGGLTVLEALLSLDAFHNDTLRPGADGRPDFADERFIYFGDQANMPYGNYPAARRTDYLRELILKDTAFLLGQRWWPADASQPRFDKPPVKAIVIACNTATAYGIEDIRAALAAWKLPVIVVGVVEAGARGVSEAKPKGAVGVLATVGTCSSGAYPKAISATLGRAGQGAVVITQQGSPSLAGVIEGDPAFTSSVSQQSLADVRQLVANHRAGGATNALDTIVLGCTHFPLVSREIDAAFAALREDAAFRPFIAPTRTYVDPSEWTARELFRELARAQLRRAPGTPHPLARDLFFISIANPRSPGVQLSADGSLTHEYKYSREVGRFEVEDTRNVPMTPELLPAVSRQLVQQKLPAVWQRLKASR